jgi:hypothetical protein
MDTDFWFWGFCTVCKVNFPYDVSGAVVGPIFNGHKLQRKCGFSNFNTFDRIALLEVLCD